MIDELLLTPRFAHFEDSLESHALVRPLDNRIEKLEARVAFRVSPPGRNL